MKKAQLITLGIAGVAGIAAFVMMGSMMKAPPKVVKETQTIDATKVLVARTDQALGAVASPESFRWQDWPKDAVSPGFITTTAKPNALTELAGHVIRVPMMAGEPVTENKIVKLGSGGILAATLPPGMRAISTKIDEKSAVAKLILPNDHVDLILTQRKRGRNGAEEIVSDTLFRNVRILAIGQQIEAKDGKKTAEGAVATLELTPKQSELLALANTQGEISLALRSIADLSAEGPMANDELNKRDRSSSIRVLKYGVKSRIYGVN
jgi:pilus assembly protein CpaB